MKSRVDETEAKVGEYLDDTDNKKNYSNGSEGRLDLNILLKRLKEKKDSDRKFNFILTLLLILASAVVFLILTK